MKALLESLGFKYKSSCSCDGHSTEKYRKDEWEVRWRKGQYKLRVKKHGNYVTSWLPVGEAHIKLNELLKETTEA